MKSESKNNKKIEKLNLDSENIPLELERFKGNIPFEKSFDNTDVLLILEDTIKELDKKIRSGRIRDQENEELKIKMIRGLAYLCKTYSEINQAKKSDELQKLMKALIGILKGEKLDI
jgi:hypothetical protein